MKITYTNEVLDHYSGQTNCEAGIYLDGEIVGIVQYVLYDGKLTVSDIFIREEFRRKGFGSRLMKFIKEKNPEYEYKSSMKTELGSKFKHKDVSLTEAKFVYNYIIENYLESDNIGYNVGQYLYHVTPKKNIPQIKKNGFIPKDGISINNKPFKNRLYFATSLIAAYDLSVNFGSYKYNGEYVIFKLKSDCINKGYKEDPLFAHGIYVDYPIPYAYSIDIINVSDLFGKFNENDIEKLYESVGDVLKPKSSEEVQIALKQAYRPKDLKMVLAAAPNLKDYIKTFHMEKKLFDLDPTHPEYRKLEIITPGDTWKYTLFNVTEPAANIILKSLDKFNAPVEKIKVIETRSGLSSNPLIQFMYKLNNLRKIIHNSNSIIDYHYYGDDYAFFGNSDGWNIFVIPPDFINKIYEIKESVENVLKPKSKEEIRGNIKDIINGLNTVNVSEFINELTDDIEFKQQGIDEYNEIQKTIKDTLHLCRLMKSAPANVEFINEEDENYETLLNLFHSFDSQTRNKTPKGPSLFRIFKGKGMTYSVNVETKTVIGHNSDFNSPNVLFFDYPHLMIVIDKWEKSQT